MHAKSVTKPRQRVTPMRDTAVPSSALMRAMLDWADNWAGVLRIELQVFTDNAAAIALYQRHGFVVEGTLRGYALRDGVLADVHAMGRLHPSPPGWR